MAKQRFSPVQLPGTASRKFLAEKIDTSMVYSLRHIGRIRKHIREGQKSGKMNVEVLVDGLFDRKMMKDGKKEIRANSIAKPLSLI